MLYEEILACLTGIGDLQFAIGAGEFDKAQKLADEFADYLRMLADDLGWGAQHRGPIDLQTPPDVIRRVMERLKWRSDLEHEEIEAQEAVIRVWQERTALLKNTCDQLLAVVPASS